ncbi:L-serine ammonia-lyase [Mycobacterium sp. Y57]|uniref:L-serine ammonia-lyase n=1 Tax=Mycolicibacterium xanthum TaxID=2796469 RepID=UPI001C851253|nr:L-serine ammonia-lyase [Mycolicibacterium xanthum]MBX7433397.1 L-serine ammonia-lyase [Mycolicibacterium xanthum]
MISVFDLFKVGIGPSSSHTVGPMRAARRFVDWLDEQDLLSRTDGIRVELFGSLGATGHGHGTVAAVVLGLAGQRPEHIDPDAAADLFAQVQAADKVVLAGTHAISFCVADDIVLHIGPRLDHHSNGMRFHALGTQNTPLAAREYYSVGGGFVLDEDETGTPDDHSCSGPVPYPFRTAGELLALTSQTGLRISDMMLANESRLRPEAEVRRDLLDIWSVMQQCVARGMAGTGVLPGGLRVRRRAAAMRAKLDADTDERDPLRAMDWVTLYALAVNEENAAGGRVVTAPTNGAAGIVPAVLHYCRDFVPGFDDDAVVRFLLAAGAVGILCKTNASISGAEVGCQGEVGSACAMAAAGLAEVLGGTPAQVENAAEIGVEHNLGLTCDPVGGLVQIPCIERNAVASVKAITAARIALRGDGDHHVGLDTAIRTMRDTGVDMADKYKETAMGGLALTVVEC